MHKRGILVFGDVDKTELINRPIFFFSLSDCSPCSSPPPPPTAEALTTPIQITTTATKTIKNSAYADPDKQKSGLCLDNQGTDNKL